MPEGHSPEEIALALSPADRAALIWMPANGDYRMRTAKKSVKSQSLWQLCHWRVFDGTLKPLVEPQTPADDPFGSGYFRASALGLQVREVITREGPSPFARFTLPPDPRRKGVSKS